MKKPRPNDTNTSKAVKAIYRYLAKGWVIKRDPLRLKRGRATMQVVNGVINCE